MTTFRRVFLVGLFVAGVGVIVVLQRTPSRDEVPVGVTKAPSPQLPSPGRVNGAAEPGTQDGQSTKEQKRELTVANLGSADAGTEPKILAMIRQSSAPREFVNEVIDQVDPTVIRDLLQRRLGITSSDLSHVTDLRRYAKAVAEVAINDTLAEGKPIVAKTTATLSTMARLDEAGPAVPSAEIFPVGARKIYAVVPLGGYDEGAVIAKWYRRYQPNIFSMQRHPVEAGAKSALIWIAHPAGLPAGDYVVQVVSIRDPAVCLSQATFSVSELNH